MNRKVRRNAAAALLLVTLGGGLSARGRTEPDPEPASPAPEETAPVEITVKGRVRLVGSAPFSSLVITDAEDQDWYLEGRDRQQLARMEQQTVTVRGIPEYRDMILADGQKAGVRRYLRNISPVS